MTRTKTDFEAVILDCDGLLIRAARVHAWVGKRVIRDYRELCAARGGGPFQLFDEIDDYRQCVNGKSRYAGLRHLEFERMRERPLITA